jgi:hypothetical protein
MPTIDPKKYVSIQTGARLAGVARITLRGAIKSGRVKGIEIDGYYFALRADCENFTRDPIGRGRPPPKKATPAKAAKAGRWGSARKTAAGRFDPAKYLSVGAAAKAAGVSRFWMRRLLQEGHVAGIEIDGQAFALRTAVEAYAATPAGHGRPRGGSHSG